MRLSVLCGTLHKCDCLTRSAGCQLKSLIPLRRTRRTIRSYMSKALISVALMLLASQAIAATKYIRFGRLIDGKGKVWTNVAVVVENDKIRSVEPEASPPSGAEVIAAK